LFSNFEGEMFRVGRPKPEDEKMRRWEDEKVRMWEDEKVRCLKLEVRSRESEERSRKMGR